MPISDDTYVPIYRYFVADIVTGDVIMEVPFQGVSWERKVNSAGSFSGSIAVPSSDLLDVGRDTNVEDHFDLYNSTVPGRYALYVTRNNLCVWGGIIWSREYSITDKVLNVTALEYVSYFFHRVFWKSFATDTYQGTTDEDTIKTFLETIVGYMNTDQDGVNDDYMAYLASDVHKRINSYFQRGSSVFFVTEEPHGFVVGDSVVTGGSDLYDFDGTHLVTELPVYGSDRTFAVATSNNLDPSIPIDIVNTNYFTTYNDQTVVQVVTTEPHGLVEGQEVYVYNFGVDYPVGSAEYPLGYFDSAGDVYYIVLGVEDEFSFYIIYDEELQGPPIDNDSYDHVFGVGASVSPLNNFGLLKGTYAIFESTYNTLLSASNARIDIEIDSDLDLYVTEALGDGNPYTFRGSEMRYVGEIIKVFADNGASARPLNVGLTAEVSGKPTKILNSVAQPNHAVGGVAEAIFTTFGVHDFSVGDSVTITGIDEYLALTEFVNDNRIFNGTYTITAVDAATNEFRYDMTQAGDSLHKYSLLGDTTSIRFDYTVECEYNPDTYKFTNTFKAWPVRKDYKDASGNVENATPLSSLYGSGGYGANYLVFEHPGNIINLNLSEDADSAATRTWMVDSGNDLGDAAEKYYGSYTNIDYLTNGWPILETAVTDQNLIVSSDEQVAPYAKQNAQRFIPPIGNITMSVNGSFPPIVSTYKPGDWCIIIPNDAFINYRIRPPYEPREGILVRKIRAIRVNVPDFPAFPETVDLELITEWETL